MTDEARITDRANAGATGGDDLGAELLRAARGDRPNAASRNRAAAAAVLAVGAGAAGATATTTAAAASSKLAAGGGALVLVKWLGISVIGASVAIGAVKYARDADTLRAKAASASAGATTAATPAATSRAATAHSGSPAPDAPAATARAARSTPAERTVNALSAPLANAPPSTKAPGANASANANEKTSPAAPIATAAPTLADEVRGLDRARTALAAGDARGALDALDAYDRAFKGGTLTPEAAVLRIEALAQNGDDAAATSRARAFLAAFPDSPQERRVRSVLETIAKKH